VLGAQNALVKLGYAVKPDGADGAATRQAIREFERAHGLPQTEITPRLVKQLNAAAARTPAH
jgi:peptidoglycan hydrolase-like protein with peptidoglycan-binding domain